VFDEFLRLGEPNGCGTKIQRAIFFTNMFADLRQTRATSITICAYTALVFQHEYRESEVIFVDVIADLYAGC
jgi:hypothetical protein